MRAASGRRDEQEKHEIDRVAVDRIEMNWPIQAREHAEKPIEPFDAGMRERETIAEAGGTQLLAGLQCSEDRLRIEVQQGGGAGREILEQLLFVARTGGANHPVWFDKVGEIHGCTFARTFS
jgi:hypothetical protein